MERIAPGMKAMGRLEVTPEQKEFWDRKKEEIRAQARLRGERSRVTSSTMIQGIIDLWMKLEEKV
jgi:hypothetical protein